jgi:hypothetical protein
MLWPEAMAGVVRPSACSNTPRWACASAPPPYLRRGVLAHTYGATYSFIQTRPEPTIAPWLSGISALALLKNSEESEAPEKAMTLCPSPNAWWVRLPMGPRPLTPLPLKV